MSTSLNSTSDSISGREALDQAAAEAVADLTLNHDEALDLTLALGALGGLRHSRACDASERSTRRYDERNHRLHEARMKRLGLECEENPAESEADMSQQVLIRSPVIHNHYGSPATASPSQQPTTPASPTQTQVPPPVAASLSPWHKAAIAAALAAGGLGGAAGLYSVLKPDSGGNTTIVQPGDTVGIENVPAGPPHPDRRKFK